MEQGLCIGCGLCQSIAGSHSVQVVKTTQGYQQPVVIGELDHHTVDKIYDCCPGTRIDGLPEGLLECDTRVDKVWGPWRRITRGWACDPIVRYEGATGGVLTALGIYLIESNCVDFILHAKSSVSDPSFGDLQLSFTAADVFDSAGSRYGPTATLIDIRDLLDRNQAFAFIGKPCDKLILESPSPAFTRGDADNQNIVQLARKASIIPLRNRTGVGAGRYH